MSGGICFSSFHFLFIYFLFLRHGADTSVQKVTYLPDRRVLHFETVLASFTGSPMVSTVHHSSR